MKEKQNRRVSGIPYTPSSLTYSVPTLEDKVHHPEHLASPRADGNVPASSVLYTVLLSLGASVPSCTCLLHPNNVPRVCLGACMPALAKSAANLGKWCNHIMLQFPDLQNRENFGFQKGRFKD